MERRNVFEDYIEMSVLPLGREPKIEILVNFILYHNVNVSSEKRGGKILY